jgi:2-hydroxychromene-2-carboxylate isomerase
VSNEQPVFFYDLYSPYSYLAALRVDDVLPVAPRWEPIVFGVVLREVGKVPWSLRPSERERGQDEVSRRARERGLPEVRWPSGWPRDSYSLLPLRAVVWAGKQDAGSAKALSMQLYEAVFVHGRALDDPDVAVEAVRAVGLDARELEQGVERADVKDELRASTSRALELGVTGIPTIAIGDSLYWGDDRLEQAAAALA